MLITDQQAFNSSLLNMTSTIVYFGSTSYTVQQTDIINISDGVLTILSKDGTIRLIPMENIDYVVGLCNKGASNANL